MAKRGRPRTKNLKVPHIGDTFLPVDFDKAVKQHRTELIMALKNQGSRVGISAMEKVAQVFFEDKVVMVAVLKHLLPQMKAVELTGAGNEPFKMVIELSKNPANIIPDNQAKAIESSPVQDTNFIGDAIIRNSIEETENAETEDNIQ